jgi:hypothetical protein
MSVAAASRWHVLYHLARADFLERLRRYSFLVTMGFALYFGYLAAVGRISLRLGDIRGVYNSAWIGALMALVVSTFLSLAGFYVVKNTIERDRQTRVGQILASTPMSKVLYVAGKWLSNYAVLAVVIAILAICGTVMQLWLGEDRHIELWKLLAPSLLLALPAMAVVAALAVLFETISWLRGGFGNVVYFFVWTALLAMGLGSKTLSYDLAGMSLVMNSMLAASNTTDRSFSFSLDVGPHGPAHSAFVWNGIGWTAPIVLSRILWVGVAVLVTLAAAVFFDRFDSARGKVRTGTAMQTPPVTSETVLAAAGSHVVALTSLPRTPAQFRFVAMLAAELRLMLKGQKWWWYIVAAGLLIACAAVPLADARGFILGCAWFWPVLLWSQMGVRELRDQTNQILFSTPHPIARQLRLCGSRE